MQFAGVVTQPKQLESHSRHSELLRYRPTGHEVHEVALPKQVAQDTVQSAHVLVVVTYLPTTQLVHWVADVTQVRQLLLQARQRLPLR